MANPNDDDGSLRFRIAQLEDMIDDTRTAAHTALARANALIDHGQGATQEQLVDLAQLLSDELAKLGGT